MKEKLINLLRDSNSHPYLFIGSGFSRRYINLPDWKDLLKKFCKDEMDFNRLKSISNGKLPLIASNLAKEFSQRWWKDNSYNPSRLLASHEMSNENSPLKFEICNYLNNNFKLYNPIYHQEIEALKKTNIDGIITTNWDCFIETIFPDHNVFIGQTDLIFSEIQGISEIYKIHGCSTKHESLVLTDTDYNKFHQLNPYLASKIITIFMEHPIIFIGYSNNDPNIQEILISISKIIPQEKQEKFSKNLIFLNRSKGREESIKSTFFNFNGNSVPVTTIETDDFSIVYDAISVIKRKIPVKYLRLFKSELHEIVKSSNPKDKIFVVEEDKLEKNSKVQFVVGVGVASAKLAERGYKGIKIIDLYSDLIIHDEGFDSNILLKEIPTSIGIGAKWIPIFKYLHSAGIKSYSENTSDKLKKILQKYKSADTFHTKGFSKHFLNELKTKTFHEIISINDPIKAAKLIPYISIEEISFPELLSFMKTNFNLFHDNPNQTVFRKLACFYDFHVNGENFIMD